MNLYMGGVVARMFVRTVQNPPEELARSAREQLALCAPAHQAAAITGPPLDVPSSGCAFTRPLPLLTALAS